MAIGINASAGSDPEDIHMSDSRLNKFVDEARQLVISDEFYHAYRKHVRDDWSRIRSGLADAAGDDAQVFLSLADEPSRPLNREELEEKFERMGEEARVAFARLVAGA